MENKEKALNELSSMGQATDLLDENLELKKQIQDLKFYYHAFHHDVLNFLLKKDLISSFMKYRKKRKRESGIFLED